MASVSELESRLYSVDNNRRVYKEEISALKSEIENIASMLSNDEISFDEMSLKLNVALSNGVADLSYFDKQLQVVVGDLFYDSLSKKIVREIEFDGMIYYSPDIVDVREYSEHIQKSGAFQNNVPGWDSNCDPLARRMAVDLSGYTEKWLTVDNYGSVGATRYGDLHKFNDQNEYVNFINSELSEGRVVTVQIDNDVDPVTGKKTDGAHWIVIVGATADVSSDPGNLKNYLILDPVDGKLKNWGSMNRPGEVNRGPRNLWVNTSNAEHRAQTEARLASRVNKNNSIFHNG